MVRGVSRVVFGTEKRIAALPFFHGYRKSGLKVYQHSQTYYDRTAMGLPFTSVVFLEELDGPAVSALGVRSRKLSHVRKG
jgi:hypothetical protein